MSVAPTPLERIEPIALVSLARTITATQLRQVVDVLTEAEWFRNRDNPCTLRADEAKGAIS